MNLSAIYEYEMVLLGKKTAVSSFFFSHSANQNEKIALDIIRHAVEKHLKWSPGDMAKYFNDDIIKRMKLESVMRFVQFPPEADEKKDYFIIAHKIYPNHIKIDSQEMSLMVYKRVLSGDLYKFPKGFFDGSLGRLRAIICMQYMLSQLCTFHCVQDVYKTFSTPKGTKLLKDYKLQAARMVMWDLAIDYVHDSLPVANKSEYWYRYYKFKIMNDKQKRNMIDKGTFIA